MKTTNRNNPAAIRQSVIKKTRNGLYQVPKAITKDQLYNVVLELIEEEYCREQLSSAQAARRYLQLKMAKQDQEIFSVLFLDSQHRVISIDEMFFGTIDSAAVHPRIILKRCLEYNCAAVILCHNHPSGIAEPSNADKQITELIKDALALCDIRVIDHFIFAAGNTVSFAERGLI